MSALVLFSPSYIKEEFEDAAKAYEKLKNYDAKGKAEAVQKKEKLDLINTLIGPFIHALGLLSFFTAVTSGIAFAVTANPLCATIAIASAIALAATITTVFIMIFYSMHLDANCRKS